MPQNFQISVNRQYLAEGDIFRPPAAAKDIIWFFENFANSEHTCRRGKCSRKEIPGPLALFNL